MPSPGTVLGASSRPCRLSGSATRAPRMGPRPCGVVSRDCASSARTQINLSLQAPAKRCQEGSVAEDAGRPSHCSASPRQRVRRDAGSPHCRSRKPWHLLGSTDRSPSRHAPGGPASPGNACSLLDPLQLSGQGAVELRLQRRVLHPEGSVRATGESSRRRTESTPQAACMSR